MNYAPRSSRSYLCFGKPHDIAHGILAVDQEKFNFTWLNFPEIDRLGLLAVPAHIAANISDYMDSTTRAALEKPPREFMRYWEEVEVAGGGDPPSLTQFLPENYLETMRARVIEAQSRLDPVRKREGNVVEVRFGA